MQTGEIILAISVCSAIALATVSAGIRRRRPTPATPRDAMRERDDAGLGEDVANTAVPDLNQLLLDTMKRDLSLAAEHVHSIRWLLEIARQHQQPIPRAALTNLELVSKSLGEIQLRIETAGEEVASSVSPLAHRPEIQPPPRPL